MISRSTWHLSLIHLSLITYMDYLIEHFDRVWPRLLEHLILSGASLGIAVLIALPLGLMLSRRAALATPVLGTLGVVYTIPGFALFAFLVPVFGIGWWPAIIALTSYALVVLGAQHDGSLQRSKPSRERGCCGHGHGRRAGVVAHRGSAGSAGHRSRAAYRCAVYHRACQHSSLGRQSRVRPASERWDQQRLRSCMQALSA